jgi:hypothetical protein
MEKTMPKKLEDILKARGYTDADLSAMSTTLNDSKFRGALEEEFGVVESMATKAQQEADGWSKWHEETAKPVLQSYMDKEQTAREEAAALREKLKVAQERGLISVAAQDEPKPEPKAGEKFDPKAHNLVTMDDASKFLEAEAEAIAAASDLSAEYYELFGKPLSYSGENGLKGMRALRLEARGAKKSVYDYTAEKFGFQKRRDEIQAAAVAANEARIRADERGKVIAETINPMLRPPTNSISPFGRRPVEVAEGKNPWDDQAGRTTARVEKALKTVLQAA